MREIKFRAWDKEKKRMMKVDSMGFTTDDLLGKRWNCYLLELEDSFFDGKQCGYYYQNAENVDIMQFTGLRDKNDKDIFEGDIIKFSWFYNVGENQDRIDEDTAVVKFTDGMFYIDECEAGQWIGAPLISVFAESGQVEIIGNIHEKEEE
jgi:uncharacterized phage protein (TIGR01671 family)